MAGNYAQLLDIINNPTDHSLPAWDNNNKLIEGLTVKQYLLTIINSLTVGYQFMGVASTDTSGGTPDQNVFYLAGAGTYAGFGSNPITIDAGYVGIIRWNGAWSSDTIKIADEVSVSQDTLIIGGEEKGELAGQLVENPEWVRVVTDNDGKILYGVKTDGKFYFGDECPPQVQEYVEQYIAEQGVDAFIKSHFDYYNVSKHHSYKEYFNVYTVNDGWTKIAYNSSLAEYDELDVYQTGEQCNYGGDTANSYQATSSHRGVAPATITQDYIIRPVYTLNEALETIPNDIKSSFFVGQVICFTNVNNEVEVWELQADDSWMQKVPTLIDNPEFIEVVTDSEGKVVSSRDKEGKKKEYVGFKTPELDIDGNVINNTQDIEERIELKTDEENRIISYRDKDGILHEEVGFKTPNIDSEQSNTDTLNVRQINQEGIPNATTETSIYLEKPKYAELWFYGVLPTDMSEARTPTNLDFLYKVNGKTLLSAKCTLAIQGHGSAVYPKKGYTFEPFNANGDPIDIKWGDMIAVDSYHLKAYYDDKTHSRGIGGAKVWRDMIKHLPVPYNKVNNKPLNLAKDQKIDAYCIADAKYSEDGFPCAFYLNDEFYGLYTMKLKKNRKNYGMEKSNKSEIFLDCLGFDVSVGHSGKLDEPFDAGAWDLKNPKLNGYEEGGEITDATVLANIERLFTFTNNITTMYSQHEDYIVLPHWLTWFIHCELIGDVDKNGNNLELTTWDATHWSILPYDMDLTVGCYAGSIQTTSTGFLLTPTFYQNFRTVYETEIKQLYTSLRKAGCIETENLYRIYIEQINSIPRDIYKQDKELWPNGTWEDTTIWPVIEQIYSYLNSRIEYLDSVWLLTE